jgi:maleylacetoacetate isomerase
MIRGMKKKPVLYSYYRSTASYRVRIALAYKNIHYDYLALNLLKQEQKHQHFLSINPAGLVPVLYDDSHYLSQSLAILEYLEETYPDPPLLPKAPDARAQVRGIAQMIACEIHPLNNLRVLNYLTQELKVSDDEKQAWYQHWVQQTFEPLEKQLEQNAHNHFCYGEHVTLADLCLIPQVYNAYRFKVPMDFYPNIRRINEHCLQLPYFIAAHPDNQPDTVAVTNP